MRFSDGMEINTQGTYRIISKSNGLYVTGNGLIIPVDTEKEAQEILSKLKGEQ